MKPCYGKADRFVTFARTMFDNSSIPGLQSTCSWNTKVRCMTIVIGADANFYSTFACSRTQLAALFFWVSLNDEMNRGSPPELPIPTECWD